MWCLEWQIHFAHSQGWGQIRFIKYKYKYKNLNFSNTNTNKIFCSTLIQIQIQIHWFKYKYKYVQPNISAETGQDPKKGVESWNYTFLQYFF